MRIFIRYHISEASMLTRFRKQLSLYIDRIAYIFLKMKLKPNVITLLGLTISAISLPLAYLKYLIPLLFIVSLSAFMDILDGAVARLSNNINPFGGILDSFCDRIEELFYTLSLIIIGLPIYLGLLLLALSYLTSYLRALGELKGLSMEGVGIAERAERILLILISILLAIVFQGRELYMLGLTTPIILLTSLSFITVIQRMHYIYKSLTKNIDNS